jgi:hypothetical protein
MHMVDKFTTVCQPLFRQYGILNISQPCRTLWPVTGIAILFYFNIECSVFFKFLIAHPSFLSLNLRTAEKWEVQIIPMPWKIVSYITLTSHIVGWITVVKDLMLSRQWLWRLPSSGMLRSVALVRTRVWQECITSHHQHASVASHC